MSTLIQGLHHVTLCAGDAQQDVDFFTGVMDDQPAARRWNLAGLRQRLAGCRPHAGRRHHSRCSADFVCTAGISPARCIRAISSASTSSDL